MEIQLFIKNEYEVPISVEFPTNDITIGDVIQFLKDLYLFEKCYLFYGPKKLDVNLFLKI